MCNDDPTRNNATRYGWFSHGQTNSDCTWVRLNQERKRLGSDVVDEHILNSLQFTADNELPQNIETGANIWKQYRQKLHALIDIVHFVPVFEKCVYEGFERFRRDNVQYMEVRDDA